MIADFVSFHVYLAQLQKQYQELQQTADNAISERHQQFLSQEQTLNRIIVSQQENLAFIEEWLAIRKKVQQRGIEIKIGVSQTTQEYYYTKQQIESEHLVNCICL